jgi:hypothetical protein
MTTRRFPAPWSAEPTPNCFIVRDADDQQLACVYYESEPGRRSAAKLLSKDEANCGEYCQAARAIEKQMTRPRAPRAVEVTPRSRVST